MGPNERDASPDNRLLVLAGPTASGKTRVALALAEAFPIEVVSADSVLHTVVADGIYTPAQICTAEYARACKVYGIL